MPREQFAQACEAAELEIDGNQQGDPQILKPDDFYRAFRKNPFLAMGEGFGAEFWTSEDLSATMEALIGSHIEGTGPALTIPQRIRLGCYYAARRLTNPQRRKPTEVATHHYDIGRDYWAATLGPSMKYTGAYWHPEYGDFDLDTFQELDLKILCERLQLEEGMKVLDIGFGFGTNTRYMVENYGVEVTGLTVSREQMASAEKECADIEDKVRFILKSWDQISPDELGQFDRFVSIEMIEAVGPKNLDDHFRFIAGALRDGGLAVIQGINSEKGSHATDPYIDKYIFRNGVLVKLAWMIDAAEKAGLVLRSADNSMADGYVQTLDSWNAAQEGRTDLHEKYRDQFKDIFPYKTTDDTFWRLMKYYFLACKAGFSVGHMHNGHFVFQKQGAGTSNIDVQIPRTREEVFQLLGRD